MERPKWYWHIHHHILLETSPDIEERIQYIKEYKPSEEMETRLRLLKPVRGKLPQSFLKAWKECGRADEEVDRVREESRRAEEEVDRARLRKEYRGAWDEYYKAREEYVKAQEESKPEIEALHAEECKDCPWDGKTIFPE